MVHLLGFIPIGLYVDGVILTLSDVRGSLSPFLSLTQNFGQLSGFTINWEKSLFMPLSDGLTPPSSTVYHLKFPLSTLCILGSTSPGIQSSFLS